jgi:hypothetical protein
VDVRDNGYVEGEEVVVRLGRARVFDPQRGVVLERRRVPPWTIGRVIHRSDERSGQSYVLTFRHRYSAYLCAVDGAAIEGTA